MKPRRLGHRVGAVGDDDAVLRRALAGDEDGAPVLVLHLEAVDQLVELDLDRNGQPDLREDLGKVAFLEGELALDRVVGLVEGASGNDDPEGFGVMVPLWLRQPLGKCD